MNNNKNNIQSNMPSNVPGNMQLIDYYNNLISIKKELEEKIYKKLSKDESFSEMLDNIKNNFVNNNISIVEDNLSKSDLTNYKGFNGKLINILEIIENILTNFSDSEKIKTHLPSFKIDDYSNANDTEGEGIPSSRLSPEELENKINKKITALKILDEKEEKYKKILKYIYTLKYYILKLRQNDKRGEYLDANIKRLNELIPTYKINAENALQQRKVETDNNGRTPQQLLSSSVEELKIYHEEYKKFYKELCNYLKMNIYEMFDIVKNTEEEFLNSKSNLVTDEKQNDKQILRKIKDATENYDKYINNFKKDIYYNVINIINIPSTDDFIALQDSNNERIDLESRKKLLAEMKELLDTQLKKLNDVLKFLISSQKEEYIDEIKGIRAIFKDYGKEKEYKDPILTLIVSEENDIVNLLAKNAEKIKNYTERTKKQRGGERKNNKYYEDKYVNIKKLKENIEKLIKKIKETEGFDDNNDPFENKDNKNMILDPKSAIISIYKNIWNDYVKETKKNKAKGVNIENLKQDDRLYNRFIENNLDPTEVLKITFQDKVIFICIILIIRTFAMVLIEFLIEYDFISTLYRGILVYSILYILLIILCVVIINYDSYKLRILVNYLNIHINSSNIYFHIILFALFNGLILIIINNNELKNIDNVFSYTYIYKYIFEIADKSSADSELRLSQKNKIMLQYRMDIITMIVFIFTSLLILII
jgi:hypothetical protein